GTTTVVAPGLQGDEVGFIALPEGDLIVEKEDGGGDLSPLADAIEQQVPTPYRAVAARQDGDRWGVGAKRIEVAEGAFPQGETLELSRKDSWDEFRVDGVPSDEVVPPELRRLGERTGRDFFVKAERIDGDLWEVRVSPL